jgi:MOSC domain-containing protein YiiM
MSEASKMGRVVGVCVSHHRQAPKKNIDQGILRENWGLEGDAHAGTGREISLLAAEDAQEACEQRRLRALPGVFAENITTRGINLVTVRVGERIRLGDATLQVVGLGKDPSEPHTYAYAGISLLPEKGVFAKVIKGGTVKVGDPVSFERPPKRRNTKNERRPPRDAYGLMKERLLTMVRENNWASETIRVTATPLTPEQAIGNPEDRDYPLLKGKERIMEARFRGAVGHAFTDMYGNFSGTLLQIASMPLENNFRRAIFVASLNAVMRSLGLLEGTIHCKDDAPPRCALELVSHIRNNFGRPRIAMVGFQPRMVEALAKEFDVRVTDLDPDNIGRTKFGLVIGSPQETLANIAWSDLCVVTGTTVTNGTLLEFLVDKPRIFYGVSIAGAADLLGLTRFCPYGM